MLIHVFLLMRSPGERQNHKCTHFNIINIIWLPLCSPPCPGFSLPMAAEKKGGRTPRRNSPPRQTGTATRNSNARTQETSPGGHNPHPERGAAQRGRPRAVPNPAVTVPNPGVTVPPRWLRQHRLETTSQSCPECNQKPFSPLQHTVICLYPSTFHCCIKGKTGVCIF